MPYRRGRTYYVRVFPSGYPHRIGPLSTRTRTKSVAQMMEGTVRELAATGRHDLLDALRAGDFTLPELHTAKVNGRLEPLREGTENPPLSDAVWRFLRSHDDMRYKHAMDRLLEVAPDDARVSWLAEPSNLRKLLRRYREEGLSAATERREIPGVSILVREHFGEARRREIFQELSLRRPSRGRDRWLTTEEIRKVRQAAGDWWLIIGTAIVTGARRGELLALRVRDIDFRTGAVVIQKGKTARARRVIPLAGAMLEALRRWVEKEGLGDDDRVFSEVTKESLRYAWERIRKAAGIGKVRFHDLRHTYAVHCSKSGMPIVELQQRLGHATITMTQRYAVYAPPIASVHYQAALKEMGLGVQEAEDQPDITPRPVVAEERTTA